MRTKTKVWLLVATSLVLVGGILFAGVMTTLGWDFSKLSTVQYESNLYTIDKPYQNIRIITDTAHITLVPSQNAVTSIDCYEQNNVKHSVAVEGDTLVVQVVDTRAWYEHIGITVDSPYVKITVPKRAYNALTIQADTSDVEIAKELHVNSIDVSTTTGDVINRAAFCQNVTIQTSTGDVCLDHITATETISVVSSTGDVTMNASDGSELHITTSTGDVTGTLLTEKVFITQTETGDVAVPPSTTGGRCEITTDTGVVSITLCS